MEEKNKEITVYCNDFECEKCEHDNNCQIQDDEGIAESSDYKPYWSNG